MKVYYAHSLHLYGTEQERRDINLLKNLGFEVENPNNSLHELVCDNIRADKALTYDMGSDLIMDYFERVVESCDALAFRAHYDGKIPSGVGREVKKALALNKPIIQLPSLLNSDFLDKDETRQILKLIGKR